MIEQKCDECGSAIDPDAGFAEYECSVYCLGCDAAALDGMDPMGLLEIHESSDRQIDAVLQPGQSETEGGL